MISAGAMGRDRRREKYVSFQFKGEATDEQRRLKGGRFIGRLLTVHGFGIQINQDNVIARLESRKKDYRLDRIKSLGCLSLHTRQLDMIMANARKVEYCRRKIDADIRKIPASGAGKVGPGQDSPRSSTAT